MAAFTGTLNTNEFYNSLYNAYRLIETYADSLSGMDSSLASEWRQDGGMYGDKSVYTSMDILSSREWDQNDTNVLAPEMRVKPTQQEIVVDKKRQIGLYTEAYMSKRAWMDPSVFSAFQAVVGAQVGKTKRLYDTLKCNVYAGTTESNVGDQTQTITFVTGATTEETNRLEAQAIAQKIADVFVALEDPSRDYNDNQFVDAYKKGDFKVIWNADFYNRILKIDLPTIFHKDELLENGKVLPARYFGNVYTSSATADGTDDRAMEEYKIRVDANGDYDAAGTAIKVVFPGDILPQGTPIVAPSTAETTGAGNFTIDGKVYPIVYYSTVHAYAPDAKKICKIVHKNAVKFLSSFETETEFWNPKALTTNRYLTWCFADPDRLAYLPFVSINEA
jgi:hypothetical protein